jgi:hypothetical protein
LEKRLNAATSGFVKSAASWSGIRFGGSPSPGSLDFGGF